VSGPGGPPRYKVAVVVWLAIYPSVLVTLVLVRPYTHELALPLQVLVLTAIVVPVAVWILIPRLNRLLAGWLRPGDG
jgi:antibiotic biosynthesis monooxygenase (ABM) superfamily enzyme